MGRVLRFFRSLAVRTSLALGLLVVTVCWAVIFVAHLFLVVLSQITPAREDSVDAPFRRVEEPAVVGRDEMPAGRARSLEADV